MPTNNATPRRIITGDIYQRAFEELINLQHTDQEEITDYEYPSRNTVEYESVRSHNYWYMNVIYGQVIISGGDLDGYYVANYPGQPNTNSAISGITAPTMGELEERAAMNITRINDRRTNTVHIGTDFLKKKRSSNYNKKIDYLHNITEDELLKTKKFISGTILINNNPEWSYCQDSEYSNGLRIAFKSHIDSGKYIGLFEDSVDLETFENNIYLCYLRSDTILGAVIKNIDGNKVMSFNLSNFYRTSFDNRNMKLIGNVDGLTKCTEDGRTIWYDKSLIPKYVNLYKRTDVTGELVIIEETAEIIELGKGIIFDMYPVIAKLSKIINARLTDLRRMYVINMRRPNIKSKKYQSVRKGIYISHSVPFSCEIECYGKNKNAVAKVSNEIDDVIGLSGDGSLNSGVGYPIEIQTPILKGKRGEICIAELCTKLVENSFIIDKTCGLHIHLDGSTIGLQEKKVSTQQARPESLINLYLAYRLFEPVILSFLPSTRRRNEYCADFGMAREYRGEVISFDPLQVSFDLMANINTLEAFELYWYKADNYNKVIKAKDSRYTPSRYFGVNFHSLLKDNHLEIRYHSGTLNYEKILFWIDLHGKIVEKCTDGTIDYEVLTNILQTEMNLETLTEKLFSILNLNKDTVEYLMDRQEKFKNAKASAEILIDKTKKLCVV